VRVRWSPEAREALEEIRLGLQEISDTLAEQWVRRIYERAESLSRLPWRGHVVSHGGTDEVRQVWEGPYRIVYMVLDETVAVVTVLHGSRLLHL